MQYVLPSLAFTVITLAVGIALLVTRRSSAERYVRRLSDEPTAPDTFDLEFSRPSNPNWGSRIPMLSSAVCNW